MKVVALCPELTPLSLLATAPLHVMWPLRDSVLKQSHVATCTVYCIKRDFTIDA